MRIEWTRSAEWRQAQALARCVSVPPTASRDVMADELTAWPEHVRELAVRQASVCEWVNRVSCDGTEVSLHDLGYAKPSVELSHDSDDLPPDAVVGVIEAAVASARELAAEWAAARESRRLADVEAVLVAGPSALVVGECERVRVEYPRVEHRGALDVLIAEAERLAAERKATAIAAQAAADRQEAERLAAYEADRAAWIGAHGSEHLRTLVAEGIEHDACYRDERLAADRPGWEWESRICGAAGAARGTSVEPGHITWMRRAREVAPDARLAWWTAGSPHTKRCQRAEDDECIDQHSSKVVLVAEFLGREIVRF